MDSRVIETILSCFTDRHQFGNPASLHHYGQLAQKTIESAAEKLAALIHAHPNEIIWTSGATESINLALKGAAEFYQNRGKHLITFAAEHKAVLETFKYLEKKGFEVSYLKPNSDGILTTETLQAALRPDTILFSLQHVNNETGVLQNLQSLAEIVKEKNILFHVDAAQSLGKTLINLSTCPIDLMSFSAHKCYGPKGIGALFVRQKPRIRLLPQMHGGGQQQGLRAGTLPTPLIAGFGTACEILLESQAEEIHQITQLSRTFVSRLESFPGVQMQGAREQKVPHILNIQFPNVDADSLFLALSDIAFSPGSACNSRHIETSHVLRAMGISDLDAYRSFRFSLGRFTRKDELEMVCQKIQKRMMQLVALKN